MLLYLVGDRLGVMGEVPDGEDLPPVRDGTRHLSLRQSLIRVVPLALFGLGVGIYGLYQGKQPESGDREVFVVLGVGSLVGAALLAIGAYQALCGLYRSDADVDAEPTSSRDRRPAWLDSTWVVVVLLVAALMSAGYAATAILAESYGLAAASGLCMIATVWTVRRILERRRQRRP